MDVQKSFKKVQSTLIGFTFVHNVIPEEADERVGKKLALLCRRLRKKNQGKRLADCWQDYPLYRRISKSLLQDSGE